MRTEGMGHLIISEDRSGNRARSLPSCGTVPQPTVALPAPPCAQRYHVFVVLIGSKAEQAASD